MSVWIGAGLAAVAAAAGVQALAAAGRSVLPGAPGRPSRARIAARLLRRVGASPLGRRLPRERLRMLSSTAESEWSPDEWVGAKLVAAITVGIVGLAGPIPPAAAPLALVAWRGPELALARRARRRVARASAEVPLFLDLLAVATSAGLAPQACVRAATEPLVGPLASELREALRRTDLGRRWRLELADVAERLALPDLRRAATILA
ncbi:MAG TPA: hypothetical protein VLA90_05305, partial [Actinomycetota bacterium]|nr:hypothetical protein [Actinomycetota bacterium]